MRNKIIVLLFFVGVIVVPLFSVRAEEVNSVLLLSINNVDADFIITGPKTLTKADAIPADPSTKIGFGPQFGWKIAQMLPVGTYTIVPAKINGYYIRTEENESPNKTFTVPSGDNYFFWNTNIEYAPTKIEVRAFGLFSDTLAPFTVTGPVTYQGKVGSSGSWKVEKVPQGTYTLVWDEVLDYKKPEPATITIGYFASRREELFGMKVFGVSGDFEKKQQTAPALPLPPPSKSAPTPTPTQAPAPKKEIVPALEEQPKEITPSLAPGSEQKSINEVLPQPPAKSFLGKVKSTVSSFFSKIFSIFSRRPSALPSSPTLPEVHPPWYELQGLWKVEKLYTSDSKGNWKEETLQPSQKEKYTEFKENQLCLEGNLDVEGAPILCTNYSPLTVSGNKLSFPQPNGVIANGTWTVSNGKLELNLTITEGSKTVKFKALFTKLNKPFSTQSAPKAVPAVPLQPVEPLPEEQPNR